MTRIANNEHKTLKSSDDTADAIAAHILAHSVHEAVATLKERAHERLEETIGKTQGADAGRAGQEGEEPGLLADRRARSGGAGGNRGVAPDAEGEAGEGPELSRLFDDAQEERLARDVESDRDKLTRERLTA
ncbi:MAG: hypothetical protein JO307_06270 [Bryobacterales bacterium]|nr:hypothetical protein [Bryobacterales bacterium]